MFWTSIVGALSTVTNWRVLVGIVLFMIAERWIVARLRFTRNSDKPITLLHRLGNAGLARLVDGVLLALFLAFLHPTILGTGSLASVGEVASGTIAIVLSAVVGAVIVGSLQLVPYVGDLALGAWSDQLFVQGLLAWYLVFGGLLGVTFSGAPTLHAFPGFLPSLGYFAIAWLLGSGVAVLMQVLALRRVGELRSGVRFLKYVSDSAVPLLVQTSWAVASFLPLLMYAHHIRQLLPGAPLTPP